MRYALLLIVLLSGAVQANTVKKHWLSVSPPTPVNTCVMKAGYIYVCTEISKSTPGVVTIEYWKNGKCLGTSVRSCPKVQPDKLRLYMTKGEWTIILRSPSGTMTRQVWVK